MQRNPSLSKSETAAKLRPLKPQMDRGSLLEPDPLTGKLRLAKPAAVNPSTTETNQPTTQSDLTEPDPFEPA
jgi:hypothetical protein